MLRILILIPIFFLSRIADGQTCCSGGVPLSGNIGFIGEEKGLFQFELSYDYNYLNTLYYENNKLNDDSRKRTTHSVLFKTGYNILNSLSADILFSYVQQEREINQFNSINYTRTRGIGDAIVLLKYRVDGISNYNQILLLGLGSKIPLGKSNLKTDQGISLSSDLQPGSGSYDFIYWGHFQRQFKSRPSLVVLSRIIYKQNGENNEYLGSQTYQFGNEFQSIIGVGDHFFIKNLLLTPGVSIRYRNTSFDKVNKEKLANTGGDWIYLVTSVGFNINSFLTFNISPEFPIYTNLSGTQLSTDFRFNTGLHIKLNNYKSIKTLKL